MAAYRYSPLTGPLEIRLLWLDYGQPSDNLSCELLHIDAENSADYEALSYTWGEPKLICSISCHNRGRIPITQNLFNALRQLRYVDRPRLLWVDAVCINQNDLVERSLQVRRMSAIFPRAQRVIFWLGENTFNAGLAFSGLKEVGKYLPGATLDDRMRLADLADSEQGWAMKNLFEKSWFTRIWVVQEVYLARKATVVCGDCTMEWDEFLDIAKAIHASGKLKFTMSSTVYDSLYQLSVLPQLGSPKSRTLLVLLFVFRQSQASDSRDKLFALIGIASDGDRFSSIYDYRKSVTDVYVDFACQEICKDGYPDLLTHCSLPDATEEHLQLPSWVPDWSRRLPTNPSPITTNDVHSLAGETSFRGKAGNEEGTLLIDGLFLATVERVGRSTVEEYFNNMTAANDILRDKERCDRLDECFEIAALSESLGHEYKPACIRAMLANRDHNGSRLEISDTELATQYAAHRKSKDRIFELHDLPSQAEVTQAQLYRRTEELSPTLAADTWIERALDLAAMGRRFCLFSTGLIGYVPEKAELGDTVIFFLGATVPILLRPFGDSFIVVGESYVHGMMEGEAFRDPNLDIQTVMLR